MCAQKSKSATYLVLCPCRLKLHTKLEKLLLLCLCLSDECMPVILSTFSGGLVSTVPSLIPGKQGYMGALTFIRPNACQTR